VRQVLLLAGDEVDNELITVEVQVVDPVADF
jgi:hypothetical protein